LQAFELLYLDYLFDKFVTGEVVVMVALAVRSGQNGQGHFVLVPMVKIA